MPSGLNFSAPSTQESLEYYNSESSREFCNAHGYSVFQPKSPTGGRKIYDLIMVNSELDFLEIRLHTLYNFVDYFIVVEAPKSFQGNAKPLVIADNWDRFKPYHDKIIYHKLEYPSTFKPKRAWDYEDLQRDATYEQVIPRLQGRQAPDFGDVLVVADVDEIPRPQTLLLLRTCNFPRRLTLASKFYYYSFQFLHVGNEWSHPQATSFQGWRTIKPTNLRNGDGGIRFLRELEKGTLANAGWHCSSCFSTVEQFLNKMASFSHTWMNQEKYRDKKRIATAVRNGKDVWDRQQDKFEKIVSNQDVPEILRKESDRFAYMMNRDSDNAGFTDYKG